MTKTWGRWLSAGALLLVTLGACGDDGGGSDDDGSSSNSSSTGSGEAVEFCAGAGEGVCGECWVNACGPQDAACCGDATCQAAWLDWGTCYWTLLDEEKKTQEMYPDYEPDISAIVDTCAQQHMAPNQVTVDVWNCRLNGLLGGACGNCSVNSNEG